MSRFIESRSLFRRSRAYEGDYSSSPKELRLTLASNRLAIEYELRRTRRGKRLNLVRSFAAMLVTRSSTMLDE